MNDVQATWIWNYCDLGESHFAILEQAARGTLGEIHGGTRKALADLIDDDNHLTVHGQQVYSRASLILQNGPEPAVIEVALFNRLDEKSTMSLAHKARKISDQYYNSEDLKVMKVLAECPGLGIKHLRMVFSNLDSMMERGIITQAEWRGDPVYLTGSSIQLLVSLAGE